MQTLTKTTYAPRNQTAYVITYKNVPYLCRIGDNTKSSMCIFEQKKDAHIVASIFESYYMVYNEWPKIPDGGLSIVANAMEPKLLEIMEMDADTLSYTCVKYNIDACVVHEVKTSPKKLTVKYVYVESDPPITMTVNMLNDLLSQ